MRHEIPQTGLWSASYRLGHRPAQSRIENTDIDELFDEVRDYMRRNPEVLVATLGAATIATGLVVWLNARRRWDGSERRAS